MFFFPNSSYLCFSDFPLFTMIFFICSRLFLLLYHFRTTLDFFFSYFTVSPSYQPYLSTIVIPLIFISYPSFPFLPQFSPNTTQVKLCFFSHFSYHSCLILSLSSSSAVDLHRLLQSSIFILCFSPTTCTLIQSYYPSMPLLPQFFLLS